MTREIAQKVAKRINQRGTSRRVAVYKCKVCGEWHVGSVGL